MITTSGINVAFTVDSFRERFPMFADESTFPDEQIQMFSELAALSLSRSVFGRFWIYCCMLFVAHYLAIEQDIVNGGSFGMGSGGAVTSESKSVGSVSHSVGYNTNSCDDAHDYAQTEWGRILWKYIKMFGAGGGVAWNTRQRSLTGLSRG